MIKQSSERPAEAYTYSPAHYPESLSLRAATGEDEGFLRELYAGTRTEEMELWGWNAAQKEAFVEMQFRAQSEHYRRAYSQAGDQIILLNGRPVGRFFVDRGGQEITLVDVAVLADHRNLGIGTFLIQQLLADATAARKPVRLHVLKSNPAFRLYQRLAFSVVGDDGVYLKMEWFPKGLVL